MGAWSKINMFMRAAVVALCLASSFVHVGCFMFALIYPINKIGTQPEEEKPPEIESLIVLLFLFLGFPAVLLGSAVLTYLLKINFLRRRVVEQDLWSAYGVDDYDDYERSVMGTEMHKRATKDMTLLTLSCWLVGHSLAWALHCFFDVFRSSLYPFVPACFFSGIMIPLSYMSFLMNLRLLKRHILKMDKLSTMI